jgi:hypothetical protein
MHAYCEALWFPGTSCGIIKAAFGIIDYCMHYIKLLVRYSVCFKQADSKLARL